MEENFYALGLPTQQRFLQYFRVFGQTRHRTGCCSSKGARFLNTSMLLGSFHVLSTNRLLHIVQQTRVMWGKTAFAFLMSQNIHAFPSFPGGRTSIVVSLCICIVLVEQFVIFGNRFFDCDHLPLDFHKVTMNGLIFGFDGVDFLQVLSVACRIVCSLDVSFCFLDQRNQSLCPLLPLLETVFLQFVFVNQNFMLLTILIDLLLNFMLLQFQISDFQL